MGFSGDGDATGIAVGHTTARTYRPEAQEDLAGEIRWDEKVDPRSGMALSYR
jgi:hypothetical protein